MRVWLIEIGEPLPIDAGHPRIMRTGLVARKLLERGHQVVWWASRFDHSTRTQRTRPSTRVCSEGCLKIVLLDGPGYRRSVSLSRILHHRATARMFREMASEADPPDVIVCGVPTLEFASAAVAYGESHGIPVLLDLRDLWPDIWFELIPTAMRPLARILAGCIFQKFARTCRDAHGLLAITEDFLEWGLHYAGRPKRKTDLVAPLAYSREEPPEAALRAAEEQWTRRDITGRPDQFVVCFIGTLSSRLARQGFLSDSIAALSLLGRDCPGLRIVVCGGGDDLPRWQAFAESYPQVLTVGRVNHAELWTLLQRSSVGLVPYPNSPDFIRSIPNKVAEYLSMGVPIVSSLDGALGRFLRENRCGATYIPGDPVSLAQRIRALYFERGVWSAMSNSARRAFADHFVADRVYGDLAVHLEALVNRQSALQTADCL